jgi:hypothetical protein
MTGRGLGWDESSQSGETFPVLTECNYIKDLCKGSPDYDALGRLQGLMT